MMTPIPRGRRDEIEEDIHNMRLRRSRRAVSTTCLFVPTKYEHSHGLQDDHKKNTKRSNVTTAIHALSTWRATRNGHAVKGSCDLAKSNESPCEARSKATLLRHERECYVR